MAGLAMSQKPDPETKEPIEGVGLKVMAGNPPSGTSDPPSSRDILTANGRNGSENPPSMSNVYAALQKQLERTDKVLDLFQNQAKFLQHHGESMKTQAAALRVQGEALKTQGDVLKEQQGTLKGQGDLLKIQGTFILGLINNQEFLKQENERLKKEIGRYGSILQQQAMKLKMIEGRLDKLLKGHPDNGNPAGAPPTCGGELDLKPPESNGIVLVPLNFSANKWNGIIGASVFPGRWFIQQNVQLFLKDCEESPVKAAITNCYSLLHLASFCQLNRG